MDLAPGIYRDSYGIPHIKANDLAELGFLQGLATARDRAWQLESDRWHVEGIMSEQLGPDFLGWDRFARQAQLADTARRGYAALGSEEQAWFRAYAEGVNQGFAEVADRSSEFTATGTCPGRWEPWHCVAVFQVQQVLFGSMRLKLWRNHVTNTLGSEAVELFGFDSVTSSGSNAWAVHGSRTASGLPLLAGDPHRVIEQPGVYQQIQLECPGISVLGFAFPGVPGIQHFGQTRSVAWGITNAMADYQDLYTETESDLVRLRTESIPVRDGQPVDVDIVESPRGPAIIWHQDGTALVLRYPAQAEGKSGLEALLPLLRAETVQDVQDALAHWVEPVNSVLAADSTGTTRHWVAGLVPERSRQNWVSPVPGHDPAFHWTGKYLRAGIDEVPDRYASANDHASGGAGLLGQDFDAPHRAERIRSRIDGLAGRKHDVEVAEMASIQMDAVSGTVPGLLADIDQGRLSAAARKLFLRLAAWDGSMTADSTEAWLFIQWRNALVHDLVQCSELAPLSEPTALPQLFNAYTFAPAEIAKSLNRLRLRAPSVLGLDFVGCLHRALEQVAANPKAGSWGEQHLLAPVHALSGTGSSAIPAVLNTPLAGDDASVLCTHTTPGVSERCSFGPAARYVWDLSDRSRSQWIVPLGASGHGSDPHFQDQTEHWATGALIPVHSDWQNLTMEYPVAP